MSPAHEGVRAAILREEDAPLEVRDDVELVDLGPADVRVRLTASGVCHTDLLVQRGAIEQPRPCVLGHEGAGVIAEVGAEVERVAPGDHVILTAIPVCGRCPSCLSGHANRCEQQNTRPLPRHFAFGGERAAGEFGSGTFAEEVIIDASHAVTVDVDIPLDVACLIGCGVMTGVGAALNAARVTPGSSVIVFGAGGVGVAAIQGARIAGAAEILVVDPVEPKLALARRFGATHVATPDELPAALRQVTADEGFDFAIECAGGGAVIRAAFDATRRGGTTVVAGVGSPGERVVFDAFELFFAEKQLRGSVYGSGDRRSGQDAHESAVGGFHLMRFRRTPTPLRRVRELPCLRKPWLE
jgi:S-(hydroxymethyl)glutathione dehydrogenase/alcohol dehydrogenase